MLTLQISPHNPGSENAVKQLGNNPKSIMRLMNTEPVSKLQDYLIKKWRISENNSDLVLYCRGARMALTDPLSSYQENSVSTKVPLEYDIRGQGDDAATTSSTPTASPAPASNVDSILQEIQNLATPPCSAVKAAPPPAALDQPPSKPSPKKVHAPKPSVPETAAVLPAAPKAPVKPKEVLPVAEAVKQSDAGVAALLNERPAPEGPVLPEMPLPLSIPSGVTLNTFTTHSDDSRIEAIYKEVLDKEREIFMTILDSQARWLSQLQSQMMSTVLTMHRGYSSCEEDGTPRVKKLRKHHHK